MAAPIGNSNARRGRLWRDAITRAVSRKYEGDLKHGLDQLAEKLIDAVANADPWAVREFGDRIDGKPAQSVTVAGDEDGNPIQTVSEIVIRGVNADS
jgi:hypothetical protein